MAQNNNTVPAATVKQSFQNRRLFMMWPSAGQAQPSGEAVTGAVHRLQSIDRHPGLCQFAAHPAEVHVQTTVVAAELTLQYLLVQQRFAQDLVGMLRQGPEQAELDGRELNLLALEVNPLLLAVKYQTILFKLQCFRLFDAKAQGAGLLRCAVSAPSS